jgi:glycerol-3-phosphate responsive antiterminator
VDDFESRLEKYRDSMRSCLYEIQKAKKELKNSIESSKVLVRQKISEMKEKYSQIKNDLKQMFIEMDARYRTFIQAV